MTKKKIDSLEIDDNVEQQIYNLLLNFDASDKSDYISDESSDYSSADEIFALHNSDDSFSDSDSSSEYANHCKCDAPKYEYSLPW